MQSTNNDVESVKFGDLVCAGKLASHLGVSRAHIYNLLRDGGIPQPYCRIGRSPRWHLPEVMMHLKNQENKHV